MVAVGAALLASVSAGVGASLYEARLANARFRDVRKLATGFLFDFDKEISRVPGNVKARQMLAATAQTYLDKLAAGAGSDHELKYELATAYERLGDVQGMPGPGNLGQTADAAKSYRKAVAILGPVQQVDRRYQVSLFQALGRLGRILGELGNQDEALRLAGQAAAIAEKVQAEAPEDRDLASGTASAWTALATIQLALYQAEDALVSNRKALEMYVRAIPAGGKPGTMAPVANGYTRLGTVLRALADLDGAEQAWKRAIGLREAILAENPGDPSSKAARSRLKTGLAELEYSPRYPSKKNLAVAVGVWEDGVEQSRANAAADLNDIASEVDALYSEANLTLVYLERGAAGDVGKADRLSQTMNTRAEAALRKAPKYSLLLSRLPLLRYARAAVLARTKRCDEALALSRDGLAAQRRLPGQTPDMMLDLTAPLLRHAGVVMACGADAEAKAASAEAYRLLDGLAPETGRYFAYASQAAQYCAEYARDLERASGHNSEAAEAWTRAAALWESRQSSGAVAANRFEEARAGRQRCSL